MDLAELIESQKSDKSYCVQCYMGKCGGGNGSGSGRAKCTNPLKGNASFKKLVKYLNDPLLIPNVRKKIVDDSLLPSAPLRGAKKVVDNDKKIKEHLAFEEGCAQEILGNGLIYTTCLFCYSKSGSGSGNGWNKCKNSKEGRCGKIDLGNGKYATFCYPDVKAVKHRIQIGLHINFVYQIQEDQISYQFLEDSASIPLSVPISSPESPTPLITTCDQSAQAQAYKGEPRLMTAPKSPIQPSWEIEDLQKVAGSRQDPEILHQLRSENEELKAKIEKIVDGLSIVKSPSILSLSDEEKKSVNDRVMRENISLKAHIHLLMMAIQKMGIDLASFGNSVGSFA